MVARCRLPIVALFALLLAVAVSCEKVPLLAPTGSSITLSTPINVLSANGTADIVAQLLESGGSPPHSGTRVTFTTTLGRVEPSDAETDATGRVVVKYIAGGNNGTAVITATSGAASVSANNGLRILVGSAAVGRVNVAANPNPVPANGGEAKLTATVVDINGNALVGAPVVFTSTAGTLASTVVNTDDRGNAQTTLMTTTQAVVTATVGLQSTSGTSTSNSNSNNNPTGANGADTTTNTNTTSSPTASQASGTVTVNVAGLPSILITLPTASPSKGLPSTYGFKVAAATQNASPIKSVSVEWGDGSKDDLGVFVGDQSQTHAYQKDGPFQITATVTDSAGSTGITRASVYVIPVPKPTIVVTAAPQTVVVNGTVTFTIKVEPPSGIGVVRTTIDYGDGTKDQLGGATSVTRTHAYTVVGQKVVTVTVEDTAGQSTDGTTIVSVTP